jgi:DNA-binding LacI/PurR family transcriptional regulator
MVTIKDVAKKAKVAVSSVSYAMRDADCIGAATKKRILKAAKELNYRPNIVAGNLATGKTHTIGLLVPDIKNPFTSELVQEIETNLDKQHYRVMLNITDFNEDKTYDYLEMLYRRKVDGFIINSHITSQKTKKFVKFLVKEHKPVVMLLDFIDGIRTNNVFADISTGVSMLISHLINTGHKRIVCMIGESGMPDMFRVEGYKKVYQEHGIPVNETLFVSHSRRFTDLSQTRNKILSLSPKPDAVFAFNDYLAAGLIPLLQEKGVKVPQDMAVVGFDNIEFASSARVSLTTVNIGVKQLAQKAVNILINDIEHRNGTKSVSEMLPVELVIRESSNNHR